MLLRPASPGTGVIAGGGVRAVLELGGIRDVLAKSLGTTNPINMLKAAESGLRDLRRPEEVAAARGKAVRDVLPLPKRVAVDESVPVAAAEPAVAEPAPAEPVGSEAGDGEARLTQTGSAIGQSPRHRGTLRALGLGRIGKTREHDETPVLAGMLRKVRHLVKVEKI